METVTLPKQLVENLVGYLSTKPYGEVAKLMAMLAKELQPKQDPKEG